MYCNGAAPDVSRLPHGGLPHEAFTKLTLAIFRILSLKLERFDFLVIYSYFQGNISLYVKYKCCDSPTGHRIQGYRRKPHLSPFLLFYSTRTQFIWWKEM